MYLLLLHSSLHYIIKQIIKKSLVKVARFNENILFDHHIKNLSHEHLITILITIRRQINNDLQFAFKQYN